MSSKNLTVPIIHEQKIVTEILKNPKKPVVRLENKKLILAIIISLFTVIFLWGFWTRGIYALGFNMSILGFLILVLFFQGTKNIGDYIKKNLYWFLPVIGIILSFSIYENPFLKTINIFLLPVLFIFFFSYTKIFIKGSDKWNWGFLYKVISRKIPIDESQRSIMKSMEYGEETGDIIKKIGIGFGLLFIINIFIISLLVSADDNFGTIISNLFSGFSIQLIFKIALMFSLLVFFIALKISWEKEYIIENIVNEKKIDSIVAGIVISGTLITYLVFIFSQIDAITTSQIPGTVNEVVSLAKNGFWQLFFISIVNILFFFVYFRKTNDTVQNLLSAFIIASIIILLSAGHKMFIYVYYYGLSYEKFFASYTVLYFGILFMFMIYFIFSKKQGDILKTSIISSLIMYGLLNIFPTERFIFSINSQISQNENAKIDIYQSHMLSIDILNSVKKTKGTQLYQDQGWHAWSNNRLAEEIDKKWYEKNIRNF